MAFRGKEHDLIEYQQAAGVSGQDGLGDFGIGIGIGADKTETLVWDSRTGSENCQQWIRAKFSDGSFSEPSKQNFCTDLDTPIEFTE